MSMQKCATQKLKDGELNKRSFPENEQNLQTWQNGKIAM